MDFGAVVRRADRFQRSSRPLAFAFAVVKKFGDDRGGSLAAQLTYYGFLSIFPLLLILTTILGYIGNEEIADSVLGSALSQFPVIGQQIGRNVDRPLSGSGVGLALGLLVLLYGALGSAQAAQHAMAQVWNVPAVDRPGFVPRIVRGLALFGALGVGVAITAALSGLVTIDGRSTVDRFLGFAVVAVLNVALYIAAFRALTPASTPTRDLIPGAVLGGVAYSVLLSIGTALVQHQLRHAEAVYGQFGLVLGLLAYLALVAQLSLYAAELNVVRSRHLWPRGMTEPLTDADRRALRALVRQEQRSEEELITVGFDRDPPGLLDHPAARD
jgi:YihY family inner membrane protein